MTGDEKDEDDQVYVLKQILKSKLTMKNDQLPVKMLQELHVILTLLRDYEKATNLQAIEEIIEDDNSFYVVYQWVDGQNLAEFKSGLRPGVDEKLAKKIISQVLKALLSLH